MTTGKAINRIKTQLLEMIIANETKPINLVGSKEGGKGKKKKTVLEYWISMWETSEF